MKNLPQELNFNHWISVLLFLEIQSVIFDEISLPDLSVAECSIKNANHSFQVRRYYSKSYISNDSTTPVFFHPSIRLPFTSFTIFFFFYVYTCVVCVFRLYIRSSGPWLWGYFRPVAHSSPPTIAVIVIEDKPKSVRKREEYALHQAETPWLPSACLSVFVSCINAFFFPFI